jgi:hypothetical protein
MASMVPNPPSLNINPNLNNDHNNDNKRTRQEVQPFRRGEVTAPSMQGLACV